MSTGHLVTATIAYNELRQHHPEVLKKVEKVLKPLSEFFMETQYAFVEAAGRLMIYLKNSMAR
jgi:hypothetical protein